MSRSVLSTLAGRRVLVTGASGFIGRRLCARLLELEAEVHGAARGETFSLECDVDSRLSSAFRWHRCDLTESGSASALLRATEPDVVFHLASVVHGSRERRWVRPMLDANLCSTVDLLDGAVEIGCERFVMASSLEEAAPGETVSSPYAAAKTAASIYADLFSNVYELPVTKARIFMVYGPGPQDTNKLVPFVIRELLAGRAPKMSSGRRDVDWVFVDDVVEGLVHASIAEAAAHQTVDLGTGRLVEVRQVGEMIAERVRRVSGLDVAPEFGALPDRSGEVVRVADVEATKKRLGWSPEVSLEAGLDLTIDWFENQLG